MRKKALFIGVGTTLGLGATCLVGFVSYRIISTTNANSSVQELKLTAKKEARGYKMVVTIQGQDLPTSAEKWSITSDSEGKVESKDWTLLPLSTSSSVFFEAEYESIETNSKYFFRVKDQDRYAEFVTPQSPKSLLSGLSAVQGATSEDVSTINSDIEYSGLSSRVSLTDQNKWAEVSLPTTLESFSGYNFYDSTTPITWSLESESAKIFTLEDNKIKNKNAIELQTEQQAYLWGTIEKDGFALRFRIKVNLNNKVDRIIFSTKELIMNDKLYLTIRGVSLPLDFNGYKIEEKTGDTKVSNSDWKVKEGTSLTPDEVTFEASHSKVYGKSFVVSLVDDVSISKEFTISKSIIESVKQTAINQDGSLSFLMLGQNLSSDISLYEFESTDGGTKIDASTISTIKWEGSNSVRVTIDKPNTIGMYGKSYTVKIKEQTSEAMSFKLPTYTAPTEIDKHIFFESLYQGESKDSQDTKVNPSSISIDGLSATITTVDYVKLTLNGAKGLLGALGFSNNDDQLIIWNLEKNVDFTFDMATKTLKNKTPITTEGLSCDLKGIMMDSKTGEKVEFIVKLTFKKS